MIRKRNIFDNIRDEDVPQLGGWPIGFSEHWICEVLVPVGQGEMGRR